MNWSARRLGHVAQLRVSNVDKHSVEGEPAVRLCNYTDVYKNELITNGMPFMEATATLGQIAQFGLRPGDTIFTKDSETADDIGIPAFVVSADRDLVCGYHLAILRPDLAKIAPKYLFWAMQSEAVYSQWAVLATGVTRVGLKQGDMTSVRIEAPGLVSDQQAIADFLDRETAKIDVLIEKQNALIDGLRERRLSAINTVLGSAKGRNGTPLRQVVSIQSGVTLGKTFADISLVEYPYLRVANVQTGYVDTEDLATIELPVDIASRSMLRAGDVLITEGGDRAALARGSLWSGEVEPCLHQNHIYALRPDARRLRADYLVWLLEGSDARQYFESTRRQTTNLSATNSRLVRAFRFTLPSLADQDTTLRVLHAETSRIDALIAKAERFVELAKERRSALITAAVTGQIDVTGGAQVEQTADDPDLLAVG